MMALCVALVSMGASAQEYYDEEEEIEDKIEEVEFDGGDLEEIGVVEF